MMKFASTSTATLAMTALLWATLPAYAGELVISDLQGQPGEAVTVSLTYTPGARPAAGVATDIRFNTKALRGPRCVAGTALAGTGKEVRCAEPRRGVLRVGVFGLNLGPVPGGEVARVTFDVAPNARPGTYRLHQKATAADAQGKDFVLKHRSAVVVVGAR